jgi:hypothetical protein
LKFDLKFALEFALEFGSEFDLEFARGDLRHVPCPGDIRVPRGFS